MWYVLKYEYGYKLGDCLTFCEKDAECPDLKAQGNISERVDLGNFMNFQVCLQFSKCRQRICIDLFCSLKLPQGVGPTLA